jgi:hypothetical protein
MPPRKTVCWKAGGNEVPGTVWLPFSLPKNAQFLLPMATGRRGGSIDCCLSEEELRQQPHAGGLFVVEPGVCGLPADEYAG